MAAVDRFSGPPEAWATQGWEHWAPTSLASEGEREDSDHHLPVGEGGFAQESAGRGGSKQAGILW